MNLASLCYVAVGGAIGSVARALVSAAIPAGRLPWATIVTNIVGSLFIGWLLGRLGQVGPDTLRPHSFWVIGVCGGFTTFSSFSWQTIELMLRGNWAAAGANILLSVMLCLVATWLGWRLTQ